MKTFTEIYESVPKKGKVWFTYKEIEVIPTQHVEDRKTERGTTWEYMRYVSEKLIDYIIKSDMVNQQQDYLIYSKKFQRGIVVSYNQDRIDKFKKHDNNIVFLKTVLDEKPEDKTFAKRGTKKIVVENKEDKNRILNENFEWESNQEVIQYFIDKSNVIIDNMRINSTYIAESDFGDVLITDNKYFSFEDYEVVVVA